MTANRALEAMFGWAVGELMASPSSGCFLRLPDVHVRHRTIYSRTASSSDGRRLQLVGERKDGSTFPIEVSLNHVATLAADAPSRS